MPGTWKALSDALCTARGAKAGCNPPEYSEIDQASDQWQNVQPPPKTCCRDTHQSQPREEHEKRPDQTRSLDSEAAEHAAKSQTRYDRMLQKHKGSWEQQSCDFRQSFKGSKSQQKASEKSFEAFSEFFRKVQEAYVGLGSDANIEHRKQEARTWHIAASLCMAQAQFIDADVKVKELAGED